MLINNHVDDKHDIAVTPAGSMIATADITAGEMEEHFKVKIIIFSLNFFWHDLIYMVCVIDIHQNMFISLSPPFVHFHPTFWTDISRQKMPRCNSIVLYCICILFMYFVLFQGEDSRYAVVHLVQTFCDAFYICRNKIFNNWTNWQTSRSGEDFFFWPIKTDVISDKRSWWGLVVRQWNGEPASLRSRRYGQVR